MDAGEAVSRGQEGPSDGKLVNARAFHRAVFTAFLPLQHFCLYGISVFTATT